MGQSIVPRAKKDVMQEGEPSNVFPIEKPRAQQKLPMQCNLISFEDTSIWFSQMVLLYVLRLTVQKLGANLTWPKQRVAFENSCFFISHKLVPCCAEAHLCFASQMISFCVSRFSCIPFPAGLIAEINASSRRTGSSLRRLLLALLSTSPWRNYMYCLLKCRWACLSFSRCFVTFREIYRWKCLAARNQQLSSFKMYSLTRQTKNLHEMKWIRFPTVSARISCWGAVLEKLPREAFEQFLLKLVMRWRSG